METWYYEVVSIDGDYADLKRTDIETDDLKLVARALLPAEIMEGSRLKYELMQYEIIEQSFEKIMCCHYDHGFMHIMRVCCIRKSV